MHVYMCTCTVQVYVCRSIVMYAHKAGKESAVYTLFPQSLKDSSADDLDIVVCVHKLKHMHSHLVCCE